MAKEITMYNIMICSRMDEKTKRLRDCCRKEIYQWNEMYSYDRGICFIPIGQEDVIPDIGKTGQDVIDKQILEKSDLGIVIFKSSKGTPYADPVTGKKYESGTEYELEQLINSDKIPYVYINNKKRMGKIKERIPKEVYYGSYKTENDFSKGIRNLIDTLANRFTEQRKIDSKNTESILRIFFMTEKSREAIYNYVKTHPATSKIEIAKSLRLPHQTVDAQLTDLLNAGLIQKEKVNNKFVYSITESQEQ